MNDAVCKYTDRWNVENLFKTKNFGDYLTKRETGDLFKYWLEPRPMSLGRVEARRKFSR